MSYEQLRSSLSARLLDRLPVGLLRDVLQELDNVAADYEIKRTCTDLITAEGLPEVVRLYCAALAVENKSMGTINGYRYTLQHFFETVRKPFNTVSTNDIRVYLFNRQTEGKMKKSSVEHLRVVINAFYSWLVDEEIMERNPARKIAPIKYDRGARQAVKPIDLEYLRKACSSPLEKALIDFLYSTGCRVSECAALDLTDIDWDTKAVHIRHGKGDKARTTYFNAEAEVSLREYLSTRKHESTALFGKGRAPYDNMSKERLEKIVRDIRERAGQPSVTPHVLRHTFATNAISNGAPIQHVQQLMGHVSLDTTMIYTHQMQDDIMASHKKFVT